MFLKKVVQQNGGGQYLGSTAPISTSEFLSLIDITEANTSPSFYNFYQSFLTLGEEYRRCVVTVRNAGFDINNAGNFYTDICSSTPKSQPLEYLYPYRNSSNSYSLSMNAGVWTLTFISDNLSIVLPNYTSTTHIPLDWPNGLKLIVTNEYIDTAYFCCG